MKPIIHERIKRGKKFTPARGWGLKHILDELARPLKVHPRTGVGIETFKSCALIMLVLFTPARGWGLKQPRHP